MLFYLSNLILRYLAVLARGDEYFIWQQKEHTNQKKEKEPKNTVL